MHKRWETFIEAAIPGVNDSGGMIVALREGIPVSFLNLSCFRLGVYSDLFDSSLLMLLGQISVIQ